MSISYAVWTMDIQAFEEWTIKRYYVKENIMKGLYYLKEKVTAQKKKRAFNRKSKRFNDHDKCTFKFNKFFKLVIKLNCVTIGLL